jgi:hypothetical protein
MMHDTVPSADQALEARSPSVTRDEIAACADEATLAAWYLAYLDCSDELRAFIDGLSYAGVADEDWLRRAGGKLAYWNLTRHWIENRMLVLGFTPPWPPKDPRARTIRAMEGTIARLRKALDKAGIPLPAEVREG